MFAHLNGTVTRIDANAVVLDNVPPDSIAVGIPAKARKRTGGLDDDAA